MFNYTVMRQDKDTDLWHVWDVQASSSKEAAESAADISGNYIVIAGEPETFKVDFDVILRVATES